MILIADSGSTKTNWCLSDGQQTDYFSTQGINPYFISKEEITALLNKELLSQIKNPETVANVYFYGAGCGTPEKNQDLFFSLTAAFTNANIEVKNDIIAAARALYGNDTGIVAILGTGSNTCYYNGKSITQQIGGLGYILGDEGSGAHIGKTLLQDFLNHELPEELLNAFQATYHISPNDIINAVYKKPLANRYLASFSKFIGQYIDHPHCQTIVSNCFDAFFRKNILKYPNYQQTTVSFVGSVAFHYSSILTAVAQSHQVKTGKIISNPITDLAQYHLQKH